jgi:hypothetical protein
VATGLVSLLIWIPIALKAYPIGETLCADGEILKIWIAFIGLHAFWSLITGVIIISAGIALQSVRGRRYAQVAAVLAMVPLSAGVVIGLPIGLWVLSLLQRRDVQDEFRRARWLAKNRDLLSPTDDARPER